MSIIWPNMFNPEPPDEPEHYQQCQEHLDHGGDCICDAIFQELVDEAVDRKLADRKERDL